MKNQYPQCSTCACFSSCLFKSSAPEEINAVMNSKSCRTYKKNQILYLEGEKPQGVFCIASGRVKVTKSNKEGREQIVRIAKPGDNLGYHALVSEENFSDSSIMFEDAQVCFIPQDVFNKIIINNTSVMKDVLRRLASDFIEAEDLIKHKAFKPVRERMADALLMLKKSYNHTGNKELQVSISRGDLASMAGTVKETATRLLTEFKEDNIISMEGRSIKIRDWEKLNSISSLYD